ncbi:lysozyme inhibitor LprI family protein [Flavobacterium terrisoli]|uniref:lysozyme inhibitor LprI family protein n=1 Tax=Flavobacterium terrisoli TaxID=3242195 RepID=UPI00254327A8|nr:lysozyme inhibitor LprI family protein [Flavobacterium buctense]
MLQKCILSLFLLIGIESYSQTLKTVKDLEVSYQKCLDKGQDMRGCAVIYYTKTDSLLNVAYKKLRKKLNDSEKSKLKTEQLAWLKKRDQYFKKEYSKLKTEKNFEEGSSDFDMVYYDKKSQFVMKRVKELINRN